MTLMTLIRGLSSATLLDFQSVVVALTAEAEVNNFVVVELGFSSILGSVDGLHSDESVAVDGGLKQKVVDDSSPLAECRL